MTHLTSGQINFDYLDQYLEDTCETVQILIPHSADLLTESHEALSEIDTCANFGFDKFPQLFRSLTD